MQMSENHTICKSITNINHLYISATQIQSEHHLPFYSSFGNIMHSSEKLTLVYFLTYFHSI
jgi:hypothetical protein